MVDSGLVLHGVYHAGDVVELLLVLGLRPLVLALRQEFRVVSDRVVVDVEEILDIVETNDIILLLGVRRQTQKQEQCQ